MKHTLSISLLLTVAIVATSDAQYARYFLDKTMRVDLYHTGTKGQETLPSTGSLKRGIGQERARNSWIL
jgi:hypothetical protein